MFSCLQILEFFLCFYFQAEDGIRDIGVTGVQTCALPISLQLWLASTAEHRPSARRRTVSPGFAFLSLASHTRLFDPGNLDQSRPNSSHARRMMRASRIWRGPPSGTSAFLPSR